MAQFWIERVEVAGFRGLPKLLQIDFDRAVTLLHGDNRQGKSSITNAVEWCLFGPEIAAIRYGEIRERADWEVRSLHSTKCYVECTFRSADGETIKARRTLKTPRTTDFSFETQDGTKSADDKLLHNLLQISSADFVSSVHLHPEVIRNLLVALPKNRKEAIDRLLGLSELRDLEAAFKVQKPSAWTSKLDSDIESLYLVRDSRLAEKRKTVESESDVLLTNGFQQPDLTEDGAERYAADIAARARKLASTFQLPELKFTEPHDFASLQKFRNELDGAIRNLQAQNPVLKNQADHLNRKANIEGLRSAYVARKNAFTAAEQELKSHPEVRSTDQLDAERIELQAQSSKLAAEMNEVAKNATILSNALEFFQKRLDAELILCPLCGQATKSASEWRAHIEKEIKANEILEALQTRKRDLDSRAAILDAAKEQRLALAKKITDEKLRLEANIDGIGRLLERTLSPNDDPDGILSSEIRNIEDDLRLLQNQVSDVNAGLDQLREASQFLDVFARLAKAQEEIRKIEAISSSESFKEVMGIRADAEQLAEDVELLIEGLNSATNAEAKKRLDGVRASISDSFSKITARPDFAGLQITPVGDDYKIELTDNAGAGRSALPILNHADINCAALSIFLSLAGSAQISHRLGLVMLDDPSQSLDATSKRNLCAVLADLCDSRQVIVATADSELRNEVLRMTKKKKIYRLSGWSPAEGPTLSDEPNANEGPTTEAAVGTDAG